VPDDAGLSDDFEERRPVTVEEALLAALGLVAIVLLFLGLAQALEGDPRARLRARRRRLSRRDPARAAVRARAVPARSPRSAAHRPMPAARPASIAREEPVAVATPVAPAAEMGEAATPAEPAPEMDALRRAWREQVAAHIRGREFGEARDLVEPALASGSVAADDAEFLLEVSSIAIARDLWRLRRASRRGTGDEGPLSAAMETARVILESAPAATLADEPRQRAGRRLWRGQTRLGLRRWRSGDFEAAVEALFQALAVPGLDERRRRLARDLLVRTLEDAAGQSLELIPQLRGDGDRAAALEQAQRVLEHIRRAREDGVSAEDLAVATSRARQLLEHIEHTSVQ
jgi:ribosomal protein S15P/S13E